MSNLKQTPSNLKNFIGTKKRTSQGGKVKTSSINKHNQKSFKRYRGQGR